MLRSLPAALALCVLARAENPRREAPAYSVENILSSATNLPGPIAPNTLVSVYGKDLCLAERAISGEDLRGGILPNVLPGTGCRVLIGGLPANIYYASPKQINFLVPSSLLATTVELQVVMNSLNGPLLRIPLSEIAPGLFQFDAQFVVGTRADGSVVMPSSPARPGEIVVLYATGLGRTNPAAAYSQVATGAATAVRSSDFRLLLRGADVERSRVFYVGLTPGFAGLYQVNFRIPEDVAQDPEIRVGFGDVLSPEGLKLPLRTVQETATSEPAAAFHK